MRQGSPTYELDQLISKARNAQAELRGIIEGITPDGHGVVTTTVDAAAQRADGLRAELGSLEEAGRTTASMIDDLHPTTNGVLDQLMMLSERLGSRLDHDSVGHADGALTPSASIPAERSATAQVLEEAQTVPGETQYYGV